MPVIGPGCSTSKGAACGGAAPSVGAPHGMRGSVQTPNGLPRHRTPLTTPRGPMLLSTGNGCQWSDSRFKRAGEVPTVAAPFCTPRRTPTPVIAGGANGIWTQAGVSRSRAGQATFFDFLMRSSRMSNPLVIAASRIMGWGVPLRIFQRLMVAVPTLIVSDR